ncbi:MAG: diguanylate cyclase [Chlorobiaceae bacterium]|nr:diguanylate cyclase [Chlorobiaceae bacterium]NTW10276.1 diguanylate cyclase [Chlorobiaceae bacterium]
MNQGRIRKSSPIKTIIVTGAAGVILVVAGTAGFLNVQSRMLEKIELKLQCYLDLVEFRGKLLAFDFSRKEKEKNYGIAMVSNDDFNDNIATLRFLEEKLALEMTKAGIAPLPRFVLNMEGRPALLTGKSFETLKAALQTAIETARSQSAESTVGLVAINQYFLFFIIALLLTLSLTAGWQLHLNYRQTLIPLAQLAGQMKLLNRNIPESIHDTAEEIKKELSDASRSSDITLITESIMDFFDEIEAKNKKLDEINIRDEKTNLFNYRHFKEHLITEIERAKLTGSKVSLAMIDIDHFKLYNDKNGHIAGDSVLKHIADLIGSQCRASDIPARFGGEEFALLFPKTDSETAREIAERLRRVIGAEPFEKEEFQPSGQLTVSAGIATFPDDASEWRSLVNNADRALYVAKSGGRNTVVAFAAMNREIS